MAGNQCCQDALVPFFSLMFSSSYHDCATFAVPMSAAVCGSLFSVEYRGPGRPSRPSRASRLVAPALMCCCLRKHKFNHGSFRPAGGSSSLRLALALTALLGGVLVSSRPCTIGKASKCTFQNLVKRLFFLRAFHFG